MKWNSSLFLVPPWFYSGYYISTLEAAEEDKVEIDDREEKAPGFVEKSRGHKFFSTCSVNAETTTNMGQI